MGEKLQSNKEVRTGNARGKAKETWQEEMEMKKATKRKDEKDESNWRRGEDRREGGVRQAWEA